LLYHTAGKEEIKVSKGKKDKRTVTGVLDKHRSGFAFVIRDDGVKPDIYVSKENQMHSMDNDRVEVKIISSCGRKAKPEGKVIKILERRSVEILGTFVKKRRWQGVLPLGSESERIDIIGEPHVAGIPAGERVLVRLERMPRTKKRALGRIVEVLGRAGEYAAEEKVTLLRNKIRRRFPEEVRSEAEKIPAGVKFKGGKREDLRELECFTIDPVTARDFDDAVSIREIKGGYELGVHIADVSHFVKEGSAIDREAFERGTSTYLPGKVIPMLPHKLSSGVCSLQPHKDRFAISVLIALNSKGNVRNYRFARSVIRSRRRFSYKEVDGILEGKKEKDEMESRLKMMVDLAVKLREGRRRRGAIDFDFPEVEISLNKAGKIRSVSRRQRTMSHKLIEEFMILTNEVIASHVSENKIPCIYRIHEKPSGEKLESFRNFVRLFGFTVPKDEKLDSKHLQTILERIKESPREVVISTMMLRSLKQAVYSDKNKGHFALASGNYTHFTSPIRRYPDLIVHRILSEIIEKGRVSGKTREFYSKRLEQLGRSLSEKERNSESAEREVQELKLMEFVKDRIGEEFTAIVSGIISFGIFVEIPISLEGLIHVKDLRDDHYVFSEDEMVLRGLRTGKEFRIGQEIKVKLAKVDMVKREVDFLPA